jgi:hypothetical protein
VISVTENKLVMTCKDGKEYSHSLSPQVKLSRDGQPCKWDELKAGTRIRVTTKTEGTQLVIRIEAIDRQELFEGTQDGKFVSNTVNKLTMTNSAGKEQTLNLSANANVTCDGQPCKVDDLKAGMRIRTTTFADNNQLTVRVEALDKQEAFEILN